MEGRITRGTTIKGRAVNEGAIVDLDPDTYRKLELTKDIEPVPSDLSTINSQPSTETTESPKKAVATKKRK